MSAKHIVTPVEIEAAFSSLLDVVNEDTAALVLNHLELSRQAAVEVEGCEKISPVLS